MRNKNILITILVILVFASVIIWAGYITILQMDFIGECNTFEENNDYDKCTVSFLSYPISNVNGKCYCYHISRSVTFSSPTKIKDANVLEGEQDE